MQAHTISEIVERMTKDESGSARSEDDHMVDLYWKKAVAE
jgi:hypothetical protein